VCIEVVVGVSALECWPSWATTRRKIGRRETYVTVKGCFYQYQLPVEHPIFNFLMANQNEHEAAFKARARAAEGRARLKPRAAAAHEIEELDQSFPC
jgi:hypothetical protein